MYESNSTEKGPFSYNCGIDTTHGYLQGRFCQSLFIKIAKNLKLKLFCAHQLYKYHKDARA